jgi:membrane associated rhomboid family serine protease
MAASKHIAAEQHASFVFPLVGAFAAPMFIGLFAPFFLGFIKTFLICLIFFMSITTLFQTVSGSLSNSGSFPAAIFSRLRLLPGFFVFGTDLKRDSFPWVTAGIITLNTLIFFTASEEIVKAWLFVPYGDPSLPHVLVSLFTCAFLHGDIWHLAVNMVALWVFGGVVESRIGPVRFLYVYFLSILFSGFFSFALLILQTKFSGSSIMLWEYHSLGASGAVAGVMGIFVVRCYFARIKMTLPLLFLPFLSLPLKIQGPVLTGLFFALDLSGSVKSSERMLTSIIGRTWEVTQVVFFWVI